MYRVLLYCYLFISFFYFSLFVCLSLLLSHFTCLSSTWIHGTHNTPPTKRIPPTTTIGIFCNPTTFGPIAVTICSHVPCQHSNTDRHIFVHQSHIRIREHDLRPTRRSPCC